MKLMITGLLLAIIPSTAFSQSTVNRTYPVAPGQKIELKFDYPKIIHVSTWDKKEIGVTASVNINEGKSDGAFTLLESRKNGKISISNKIDLTQIPDAYYVVEDGKKTRMSGKAELDTYRKNHPGAGASYQQKDMTITIEVKLPANANADIVSTYGIVELENLNGNIKVEAIYGGIDASLNEKKIGEIKLTNRYGKIFSDLKLKPTQQTEQSFYTSITASPGTGSTYDISSSYGNIYLRKGVK
ncbi:DUF4097 family beta strand repeat-containing protein [Pedobacter antarcticus]|uniref:DUF4097 family beta strand repeat-containing protein n=1 Tax=Pedobacter antarcticus TaxID=34086 RepID=UPI0029313FF3|nr:DUF4097 family beta strand repeat-containing protein [Pedobacter antarcticus]